ncbi:MAG: Na+/H+ antiporter NhaC family protein [Candidatus Egerieousia sp.]|nr:Na+/H+ antiporter NhaC family protein [Candidatus Egerieousia sp.]
MKWLRSIFRGIKVPGTYTIIFAMILLSALLTWFVPGGEYVKGEEGTLSYRDVESVPQLFGVFTALYHGFVKQSGIIIFILIVGGSFWLLNSTGAISVGIGRFIRSVGRYHKVVLVAITLLFSLAGAIFGMSEETIPFVGIVVPLVVSMGYDAFLGMLIVYVAANVGFSSAFLNPFTVGIAQEMAELPLFSGMEYRLFCWAILTLLLILFVLFYAKSVYKAPQAPAVSQPTAAQCSTAAPQAPAEQQPCPQQMSAAQKIILLILFATIVLLVVGVTLWGWYMAEISGLFLAMGIVSGIVAGYDSGRISSEMIAGAKDILSSALVVGLASGIIVILQEGRIIDSILNSLQAALNNAGGEWSLSAMYGIQALINTIIPSATAKAAITIPIMAPFSDMVGVSRQAMVLAFQFGDGFTNMITPTSGVLIASLSMARITYSEWVRKIWRPVLALMVIGLLLLLGTLLITF